MTELALRPRCDPLLSAWKELIKSQPSAAGFDFHNPRHRKFKTRVQTFLDSPDAASFDSIWESGVAVSHANPGGPTIRATFNGDISELADFIETLSTTSTYNQNWEDRFTWKWPLWELYTRLNDTAPVILTENASTAMSWFGSSLNGSYRDRMGSLQQFADHYQSVIGHPTAECAHEAPIKTELDELFHAVANLDTDDIAAEIKGEYGEFYRYLYGGATMAGGNSYTVELADIGAVTRAYAAGKANDAYEKEEKSDYWGGDFWETWKETYADWVQTEIKSDFTLKNLSPDEIEPLFDAIVTTDGAELSKPVATYVMGSQWGQYTWNDIVNHFTDNPLEASQALSLFFDDSYHAETRLDAFREHTIHLTETEDRSPGSIERMATSLLMFTEPQQHLGLPPQTTKEFLESKTTLDSYNHGFDPRQYRRIIGPLRELRDEIEHQVREHDCGADVTMLDVHTLIYLFAKHGEPATNMY